jgi:hypothetical protein
MSTIKSETIKNEAIPTDQTQVASHANLAQNLKVFQDLDEKERKFNELAQSLCNQIFVLLRSAGIYDLQNEALQKPYQLTISLVQSLYQIVRTPISVRLVDGNFFMNRREVKNDFSTAQNMRYLRKIFEFLEINEMQLDPQIDAQNLSFLLQTFVDCVKNKSNIKAIEIPRIQLRKLELSQIHPMFKAEDEKTKVVTWMVSTLNIFYHFVDDAQKKRVPQYAQLKRQVIELINFSADMLPYLSALHLFPYQQGSLPRLMLDLAVSCAIWSARLGLDAQTRLDLVMTATQAYVGWALIDSPLSALQPSFLQQLMHKLMLSEDVLSGYRNLVMRALMDINGMNESVIERSILAFEANQSFKQKSQKLEVYSPLVKEEDLYQARLGKSELSQMIRDSLVFVLERSSKQKLKHLMARQESWDTLMGDWPIGTLVISVMDQQKGIVFSLSDQSLDVLSLTNLTLKSYDRDTLKILTLDQEQLLQVQQKQIIPLIFGRQGLK